MRPFPRNRPSMPGANNIRQLPKEKQCPFANQKSMSTKGGECGLTVVLPVFSPKCPLRCSYEIFIIVTRGLLPVSHWCAEQLPDPRNHILPKWTVFPHRKLPRQPKRATFWVTAASQQSPTRSPNLASGTPRRGTRRRVGWTSTTVTAPPPMFNPSMLPKEAHPD